MRTSSQRLVQSVLDCPISVVSAVHGVTGIGLTLALGADVCIAASTATFVPAFVQRAIVPDGAIAFLLPRLIGMARTKDFLMRGAQPDRRGGGRRRTDRRGRRGGSARRSRACGLP
jgi:2-(1,2-epoxy-1,2-dihydrophenyl)acetyl-CoA isomerase